MLSNLRIAGSMMALASFACGCPAIAEPFWPTAAKVYFIAPTDGATIEGPVSIVMGLSGLGVAPAGTDKPLTGHHHILVDADAPKGEVLNEPMAATDNIRHFGGGQTETKLTLAPGKHTLQLIIGDQNHIPHDPALVSQKITVTVK